MTTFDQLPDDLCRQIANDIEEHITSRIEGGTAVKGAEYERARLNQLRGLLNRRLKEAGIERGKAKNMALEVVNELIRKHLYTI